MLYQLSYTPKVPDEEKSVSRNSTASTSPERRICLTLFGISSAFRVNLPRDVKDF